MNVPQWIGIAALAVLFVLAFILGKRPVVISDADWPKAPPEPVAYMSSRNYRGLRSPWTVIGLGVVLIGFAVALVLAGTVWSEVEPTALSVTVIGAIGALFALGGAFVVGFLGIRRLRWLRAVGFDTWNPPVRDAISSWGKVLPGSSGSEHPIRDEWTGAFRDEKKDERR